MCYCEEMLKNIGAPHRQFRWFAAVRGRSDSASERILVLCLHSWAPCHPHSSLGCDHPLLANTFSVCFLLQDNCYLALT
jgi:hypothetical protein